MHTVVIAGAPVRPSPLIAPALSNAELVVAADSGAATALRLGRVPDVVVGDFDSLDGAARARLEALGVPMVEHPARKDRTDLHLALLTAAERGARQVTLLGLLGGERADHGVAGLLLLARDEFAGMRLRVLDGPSELFVVRDRSDLRGRPGDYVTLLALTPHAHGIETSGLDYPLGDASLSFGDSLGVSNALLGETASVSLRSGVLLVIHEHALE